MKATTYFTAVLCSFPFYAFAQNTQQQNCDDAVYAQYQQAIQTCNQEYGGCQGAPENPFINCQQQAKSCQTNAYDNWTYGGTQCAQEYRSIVAGVGTGRTKDSANWNALKASEKSIGSLLTP